MKYTEIRNEVAQVLGNGYTVTLTSVNKNNDTRKDALTIKASGDTVSPIFYLDSYTTADSIIKEYRAMSAPDTTDIWDILSDPDKLRAAVKPRIVNGDQEYKNEYIHLNILDMSILFYISTYDHGTITLREGLTELTGKELFASAIKNIKPDIKRISDIIPVPGIPPMLVLTTPEGVHGAAAILHPRALDTLCEMLNEDEIIILPSSIHEVIAVPGKCANPAYLDMVKEINSAELAPDEVLTNTVYIYSRLDSRMDIYAK